MKTTKSIIRPALFGAALVAAGLLLAVPGARAQLAEADTARSAMSPTNFMYEAAQGGMTEVKLGEIAEKKGTTDAVKDCGTMMVKDHTAIGEDLKTLAGQQGVTLPPGLDKKHQELVDKLSGLPGSEFDDEYLIEMSRAHERDERAFKKELAITTDPNEQAFLTKTIPVITAHLKHITGLQKTAVGSTSPQQK
jgi:putative membrane protein